MTDDADEWAAVAGGVDVSVERDLAAGRGGGGGHARPGGLPGCTSRSTPGSAARARRVDRLARPGRGRRARRRPTGAIEVVGIWSHLAFADEPDHPVVAAQIEVFGEAVDAAAALGVATRMRHLANCAATWRRPQAHFDLVRPGIAVYGLSPGAAVGTAGRARTASGDDARGRRRAGEAAAGRPRGLVRPPVHDPARDHGRARAARLRRRHPARAPPTSARCSPPDGVGRSPGGCAWTRW